MKRNNEGTAKINTGKFIKSNMIEKLNMYPQSTKYKSPFDKEGNPFKYFMDIKKHMNNQSSSFLKYLKLIY
jgi:hypothetical protein